MCFFFNFLLQQQLYISFEISIPLFQYRSATETNGYNLFDLFDNVKHSNATKTG